MHDPDTHPLSQQLPAIGHKACFCNRKTVKTLISSYEEKSKCSPSVFNVLLINIIRHSPLLARFWLFAWKIALKMLGSLHESVSFESEDKNACGKPFFRSLKHDMMRDGIRKLFD